MVEDVPEEVELALRELRKAQLDVVARRVDTERDLEEMLATFRPDLILSDYNLPNFSGERALEIAAMRCANVPFIFVSGTIGEERAIEALRHGAVDYVLKDNLARLGPAVRRALQEAAEREARRKVERELEESERRFRLFMQHLPAAAFMKDLEGRVTFANHGAETIIGKTAHEIIGRPSQELFPSEYAAAFLAHDQAAINGKAMFAAVEKVPMADGIHSFLTHRFPMLDSEGQPVLLGGIATDITERVRQEEKIRRLSRIHAVLSGINSTIVRVRERKELFREACRIAVDSGGFHMAWIGLAEPGQARARPMACVSVEHGYLDEDGSARLSVAKNIAVAERALRQRQMVVVDDVTTDPSIVSKPLPGTYRSLAALPLLVEGEATGVLVLYAPDAHFFDQDERKLLKELAGDISFALDHIAKEERLNYVAYYDTLPGLANPYLFFYLLNANVLCRAHPTNWTINSLFV
jgi:PAS domain S-box-containing protein